MGNVLLRTKQRDVPDPSVALAMPMALKRRWPFFGCGSPTLGIPAQIGKYPPTACTSSASSMSSYVGVENPVPLEEVCVPGFRIVNRFEVTEYIGCGTFGKVVKAVDLNLNLPVAVKITKDAGRRLGDDGNKEAAVLRKLNEFDSNDNFHIVKLFHGFSWRDRHFFVFELLPMSLKTYMDQWRTAMNTVAVDTVKGLPIDQTITISYQLLEALAYLARFHIMHCDLKPDNIMIKDITTLAIKVIDLGAYETEGSTPMLYLQTRHYRSPEVILGLHYTCAIDMWSLGCIITEMHIGRILFPGNDELDQMYKIMEVFGKPSSELLKRASRVDLYFTRVYHETGFKYRQLPFIELHYRHPGTVKFFDIFNQASDCSSEKKIMDKEKNLFYLLQKIFVYDSAVRPPAQQALTYRLFKRFNDKKRRSEYNF